MVPPEVAAAMAYQISLQVRKSGGQCLAPPVITSKACYEIYCYQWPVLLTFLWAMTPKVEAIVGRPLLPSYSYFRTYQQGDVCRIHADRPACEHSVSLTLRSEEHTSEPQSLMRISYAVFCLIKHNIIFNDSPYHTRC